MRDGGGAIGYGKPAMNSRLLDWLAGRLSSGERVWTAISPALVLLGYFAVAGGLYFLRNRAHGQFRDEEMDSRGDGGLTGRRLRHFFAWTMSPWCKALAMVKFPPNAVTMLSLVIALGAGVGVAAGRFALGGWLFVMAGVLDFLDGRLARSTGRVSLGGAALDSVLDRYVESALIAGLCWYYRQSWVLVPCLLALTGSLLVPYVRARGESLGIQIKDAGFMQRPERVLLLGGGTALSPIIEVLVAPADPHPPHRLAILSLLLLGIGSHATAIQRLLMLLRRLEIGSHSRTYSTAPLKSVLANVAATAGDFGAAVLLFHALSAHPTSSTAAGCVVGAFISFVLSRGWAFDASVGALLPQIVRYGVVSLLTLGLNVGGVALLLLLHMPFIAAWCVARFVVFVAWSYPLQRDFVFATADPTSVTGPPASQL